MKKSSYSLLKPAEFHQNHNHSNNNSSNVDDSTISTLLKKSCFKYFANDSTNFSSSILMNTHALNDSINLSQEQVSVAATSHQVPAHFYNQHHYHQDQDHFNKFYKENEQIQNDTSYCQIFNSQINNNNNNYNNKMISETSIQSNLLNQIKHNTQNNEYQQIATTSSVNFLNSNEIFESHENNIIDLTEDDLNSCNQQNFFELFTNTSTNNTNHLSHNHHHQISYFENTCV